MITKEQMNTIAAMIGVKADVLAKAISDEQEIKIELPKGRFLTTEDEATLLDNHGKKKYDEGVSKKAKENFEGKTKEAYDAELKASILEEAQIEPNKKLEEAQKSIEKLQKTVETLTTEKQNAEDKFSSYKRKQSLLSEIPNNSLGLSNETVLNEMISSGWDFSGEEPTLNGEIPKDNLQNPLKRSDIFNQFLDEKGWLKVDKQGRGKGDEGGSGEDAVNYEQFVEQCKADNINPAGEEAQARAAELAKENPDFYN